MIAASKVGVFVLALAVIFALSFGAGRSVGPIGTPSPADETQSPDHGTSSPSHPGSSVGHGR